MIRRRLTQEERRKETRQLLLESAVETFARLGFHGASIEKIAENAGFSKGAIYAHFHSKEELFQAILEHQMNLYVCNIQQMINQQPSLSQLIETMNEHFLSIRKKNRTQSMLIMEFLLYAMREESFRLTWSQIITESVEQISNALEKLMSEENGTSLSTNEMAWTILSLENSITLFYYISKDHIPLNLYRKSLQNTMLPPQLEN